MINDSYYNKYLKYKNKYIDLKNILGGASFDSSTPSTVRTLEELEERMATMPDYEGKADDVSNIISLYDKKRWNVIQMKLGVMERRARDSSIPSTVGTLEELEARMANMPDYEGKPRDVSNIISLYDKKKWSVIQMRLGIMERRAKESVV